MQSAHSYCLLHRKTIDAEITTCRRVDMPRDYYPVPYYDRGPPPPNYPFLERPPRIARDYYGHPPVVPVPWPASGRMYPGRPTDNDHYAPHGSREPRDYAAGYAYDSATSRREHRYDNDDERDLAPSSHGSYDHRGSLPRNRHADSPSLSTRERQDSADRQHKHRHKSSKHKHDRERSDRHKHDRDGRTKKSKHSSPVDDFDDGTRLSGGGIEYSTMTLGAEIRDRAARRAAMNRIHTGSNDADLGESRSQDNYDDGRRSRSRSTAPSPSPSSDHLMSPSPKRSRLRSPDVDSPAR